MRINYLSVCLSVCLSVGLSVCLSICLSVCLFSFWFHLLDTSSHNTCSIDNKLLAKAIRVVDDLKRHPLMFDDNMRYRTFICASLKLVASATIHRTFNAVVLFSHYFLEAWLIEMTMRKGW